MSSVCSAVASSEITLVGVGEIADVEEVDGIRVVVGEDNRPMIEYLVRWKVCWCQPYLVTVIILTSRL